MSERKDPEDIGSAVAPPTELADEMAPQPPRGRGSRRIIGPFTIRHVAITNTVIAVVLIVLFVVTRPLGATGPGAQPDPQATFYRVGSETQGLDIGQRAPDFVGTDNGQTIRLTDLDGHQLSMAELNGHPLWINFWATWCPPCQKETPVLRDAFEAHRKFGLVLVGISIQEEPAGVREYVTRYGLTYTIGMDVTGAIMHTYRVFGIPTHYFIDRDGVIRDRVFGPVDPAGIDQRLAKILKP
jgi:cytochrome c biogenesis protein CcmG/thiol:disulfide interchange protein DsbE